MVNEWLIISFFVNLLKENIFKIKQLKRFQTSRASSACISGETSIFDDEFTNVKDETHQLIHQLI